MTLLKAAFSTMDPSVAEMCCGSRTHSAIVSKRLMGSLPMGVEHAISVVKRCRRIVDNSRKTMLAASSLHDLRVTSCA